MCRSIIHLQHTGGVAVSTIDFGNDGDTEQPLKFFICHQVSLSYLEIYNENIRDLLNPSSGHLELREESSSRNRGRGTAVAGLTEIVANSTQEVIQHMLFIKVTLPLSP